MNEVKPDSGAPQPAGDAPVGARRSAPAQAMPNHWLSAKATAIAPTTSRIAASGT